MKIQTVYFRTNTEVNTYIDVFISDGCTTYSVGYGEIEPLQCVANLNLALFKDFENLKKDLHVNAIELLEVKTTDDSEMFLKLSNNNFLTITFRPNGIIGSGSSQYLELIRSKDLDIQFLQYYQGI